MENSKAECCLQKKFHYFRKQIIEKRAAVTNRHVFITGAAKRIGKALSEAFAVGGYSLILHANKSIGKLEQLADQFRTNGTNVTCYACDFGNRSETSDFASRIMAKHKIDLLINNASMFENDRLPNVTDAEIDAHMNVNFHAPRLLMTQMYAACCRDNREGHIINLLDHKLRILNPDFFSYTMSKAALGTMTKTSAMQFAPNVRVNSISPGIALISGKQTKADFEASWSSAPMGRSATPAQIADAALFLDRCPAIHGEDIVIDGGQSLYQLPRDIAFLSKHGSEKV